MAGSMEISLVEGARMSARVRDHEWTIDLPERLGGTDTAPNPTEHFIAGIAACQLFYAFAFLSRRDIPTAGATAKVEWHVGEDCIERIEIKVVTPDGVPANLVKGVQRAMSQCFVSLTMDLPVEVSCSIE